MLISLKLPDGELTGVEVADDVLVYNGSEFVNIKDAKYVVLYHVPVSAYTQPFRDLATSLIVANYYVRALVTSKVESPVTTTDPLLVSVADPSGGECICFVTCNGTNLSYVKITNVD